MSLVLPSLIGANKPASATPFSNTRSVSFDGTDDFMSANNITAINSVANASYSFWYKTSATGKVGLLGGGVGTSAYHWTDGNMYVHSWVDTIAHAITIPTLGAWHHIVCTFEASGSKLYVDGSLQSTQDRGDITASDAGNGFQVGRVPYYSIPDGQKLVDEFALFTSTLTAGQITNIYNSGVPNDISSLNPVAWWRMGDGTEAGSGTTIFDMSTNSNNGTLTNGPTFSRNVPYDYFSISLDGANDYIDCGGASDFSFNNGSGTDSAFSISAWVKFDNINRARAVSKDNGTGSREYLFGTNNSNKVNMILGDGSNNLDIRNNATINTSDWFHIVSTYDGSKSISGLKVYVNADASNLTNVSLGTYAGMPQSTGNLDIGRFGNGHSFLNGLVDEVAVFSRELTADDVTNIYNTGFPNDIGTNGLNLDPLGWWRMGDNDGGTGTTVTDQGSGGNNGTLNNIASPNGFVTDVPT